MAGEYTLEYRDPRIEVGVFPHRVGPRSVLVPVSGDGCDAGPASSRRDDTAHGGVGGCGAALAMDYGRLRADGQQRDASVFCHSCENLPEYFLSAQDVAADISWLECVGFSLDGVSQGGGMGFTSYPAKKGQGGGGPVFAPMGWYCRCRTNDCV